jgi:tetratricopeptide (TPR) repeat protein
MRRVRSAAIALAASALFLAQPAGAQGIGRAAGLVRDLDGQPIRGATVTADNADASPRTRTTVTDTKGRFGFMGLRRGVWTFTVQAPGYEPVTAKVPIQTLAANPLMTFTLVQTPEAEAPSPLRSVDVEALQRRLDAAGALAKANRLEEAIAAYEVIARDTPRLTAVHLEIGQLHARQNDRAKAVAAWERAIAAGPESFEAERARTLIAALRGQP